jgi:hypothetical protein
VCRYVNAVLLLYIYVTYILAACDYANLKRGYWVPILAILCDGNNFEFFVYDSADKAVYSSDWKVGIVSEPQGSQLDLLLSTKKGEIAPLDLGSLSDSQIIS